LAGADKLTLREWTAAVIGELQAAGFEASEFKGFPLVKRPEIFAESVRLLKFHTTLAADRRIYTEGMLFTPRGIAWDLPPESVTPTPPLTQ
jgi:hypothetical protein